MLGSGAARACAWLLIGLLGLGGCAPAAGAEPRAGRTEAATWTAEYTGRDTLVLSIEALPARRENDDHASLVVAGLSKGLLRLSLVDGKSGAPVCTLVARALGSDATVEPNQLCFDGAAMRILVRSGKAVSRGANLHFELFGLVELEQQDVLADGTLTYAFEGTRR